MRRRIAAAALRLVLAVSGQCSQCGGRFEGWSGGVCDACKANGH
ncbi:hypothetical protein [Streptomyces sp. NPDC048663]